MNDPPQKNWSTLVYCQLCSPYSSLDPAHLFILRTKFVYRLRSRLIARRQGIQRLQELLTEGGTTTHSVLSKRLCGMLKPLKSLSSTHRAVPQTGDVRYGSTNSAGLTVSKSFPRPSTVTIDSSLRPDQQPLRSADPEEVNKRRALRFAQLISTGGVIAKWVDKERLFICIRHKTGEGPAVIH
jgi:hypothetical protein